MPPLLQTGDIISTNEPGAIIIVGLLALLLWATIHFRNPAGAVMWSMSVLTLLASGLFGIRDELFLLAMLLTTILIVIGISVRLMRSQ